MDNDVHTKIGVLVVESRLERDREYWIDRFKACTGWKMRIDEWEGELILTDLPDRTDWDLELSSRGYRKEIGNGQYEGGGASYEAQAFMIKRGIHISIKYMDVENGVRCKDVLTTTFNHSKQQKDVQWEWGCGYKKVSQCGKCFTR